MNMSAPLNSSPATVAPEAGLKVSLIPRKNQFTVKHVDRHWIPGNPFLTRYLDALSLMFPTGERLFIRAVRRYLPDIETKQLEEDAQSFIFQEAQHTQAHEMFNQQIEVQGLHSAGMEWFVKGVVHAQEKILSKKLYMALAAGGEHFTASMAEVVLENFEDYLDGAPDEMRALWCWHCVEEIEHKTVTFDVFQQAAKGGYFTRQLGFIISFGNLIFFPQLTMLHLLAKERQLSSFSAWKTGMSSLYGRQGIIRRIAKKLLVYLKPGFHPTQVNVPAQYYQWQEAFEKSNNIYASTRSVFPVKNR